MPFLVGQYCDKEHGATRTVSEVTVRRSIPDHPQREELGEIFEIEFVAHVAGERWAYTDPTPLAASDSIFETREEALRAAVEWAITDIADIKAQLIEFKSLLGPVAPAKRVLSRFQRRLKV